MRRRGLPLAAAALVGAAAVGAAADLLRPARSPSGAAVSMEEIVASALERAPELEAQRRVVDAWAAEVRQAGVLPNPALEAGVENVAGNGEFAGADAAETAVRLTQEVPLGGKRAARSEVAARQRELDAWTYAETAAEVRERVQGLVVDLLADEALLELFGQTVGLAEAFLATAEQRAKTGSGSALEAGKARIELATTLAEQERVRQDAVSVRRALASRLGCEPADVPPIDGNLLHVTEPPPFTTLRERVRNNPELTRSTAEYRLRRAEARLEQARRVPDVTISVGWKHDAASDSDSLIAGAGVPLPLFDRNQGAREAARLRILAAEEQARAAEEGMERALSDRYRDLAEAHARVVSVAEKVLPAVQEAYEQTNEGYQRGRFGYLDQLEAQRLLFETRKERIEAARAYHRARAAVARIAPEQAADPLGLAPGG